MMEENSELLLQQQVKSMPRAYFVIHENLDLYRKLFKYKYRERLVSHHLAAFCDFNSYSALVESGCEKVLDEWLIFAMGGTFRLDHIDFICPDCLTDSLRNYSRDGDDIKKTCINCGLEFSDDADIDDFDQHLDREVTFAPVSHLSYSNGLGNTYHPNNNGKKVTDHKGFLYDVVNANNVTFEKFKEQLPEVAFELENGTYEVWFGNFIYCRMGDFVRKAPVADKFAADEKFWHEYDALLRRAKLIKQSDFKGKYSREKVYGMQLCQYYGFDNGREDQALYNTLGREIEKFKPFVDALDRHISSKTFTETLFYVLLCCFDKKGVASKVKDDLEINMELVGFYDDVKDLLRKTNDVDSKFRNEQKGTVLLCALEHAGKVRFSA